MATYVPRVQICGNIETFKNKIGDKPAEIIGQINFSEIKQIDFDAAEFLIFTDDLELCLYRKNFPWNRQAMSIETFVKKIRDGFVGVDIMATLGELFLHEKILSHVLDFDNFFAGNDFHMRFKDLNFKLDCVAENIYPIYENFYDKIYRAFDEFKFHHFDALILSRERTPAEFIDVLIDTDALTEKIFAFARKNSALEKFLTNNENIFAEVKIFPTTNGAWFSIKKFAPADVGVYVVTHKDAKLSALPEGYKFIHAGKIFGKDLGYIGDDTGDNISRLNPFLDEVTALYWIWKNTSHTHTGFCHYRRFFTTSAAKTFAPEKILSAEEIIKILREYDIITQHEGVTEGTQREKISLSTGQPNLVKVTEKIIRAHLARTQPDYLDAFDDVINGITLFACGIHITRRNIFNAYCEWLFSFMLDATKEIRDKIQVGDKNLLELGHDYSRVAGHFAERMLSVWLIKNHLRIKELPIMYRKEV